MLDAPDIEHFQALVSSNFCGTVSACLPGDCPKCFRLRSPGLTVSLRRRLGPFPHVHSGLPLLFVALPTH